MNKRIKELWMTTDTERHNPPALEWAEKFAELIVKECAELAKAKSDSIVERAIKYAEDGVEETSAKATAWQFLVFEQEIKKHFGVEE